VLLKESPNSADSAELVDEKRNLRLSDASGKGFFDAVTVSVKGGKNKKGIEVVLIHDSCVLMSDSAQV